MAKKKGVSMDVFRLDWKKILIVVVLWFAFVILHNVVSALLGIEEALFFILAIFVLPIYVLVGLGYTAYKMNIRKSFLKKRKEDFVLMVVFFVIAVVLAIVGCVRGEGVWYIRTAIFCLAGLFLWWRNR